MLTIFQKSGSTSSAFFRIWFVLQRYKQFGFKPFMNNMEAIIEITGDRK